MAKKVIKKEKIEKYIQNNQQEYMDMMWEMYSMFKMEQTKGDEHDRFEQGFSCALGWIGEILGLELLPISDEDKEKIDSLFNGMI